jgi:ribonuclease HI
LKPHAVLQINIDGASKGNPGEAGIGVVIKDGSGFLIEEISRYIGRATNNMAEYTALIFALKRAEELKAEAICVYTDSQLVARQVEGSYQVKNHFLRLLYEQVKLLGANFKSFQINFICREENKRADELATKAVKQQLAIS